MPTIFAVLLLIVSTGISAVGAQEPPGVVRRLLPSEGGYERVEIKADAAFWKKVAEISGLRAISIKEKTLTLFCAVSGSVVKRNESIRRSDGGCVVFTAVRGMHGPMYLAVAVERRQGSAPGGGNADIRILGIEILKHGEQYGRRATNGEFLGRFRGRNLEDGFPPSAGGADAVTGATVSASAVVEGAKKSLAIGRLFFGGRPVG